MSIDGLINAMKGHAGAMDGQTAQTRVGTISAYDPARHLVRVMLQPESVLTGWLPLGALMVGGGFGIVAGPTLGMQALVVPQEGDLDSGHVICGIHSTAALPPSVASAFAGKGDNAGGPATPISSGQVGIVDKAGAVFRMNGDGSIYIKGTLMVDGPILGNADVSDQHGSLDRLRQAHNAHVHSGVETGAGDTAIPTTQDPE